MLIFKTESTNIRQAVKAFNRMEPSGAERDRPRDIHRPGCVRRYGRAMGRVQAPEEAYKELIKMGVARVSRRRGKYPLIEIKWRDAWVSLAEFRNAEPVSPDDDRPIEVKTL